MAKAGSCVDSKTFTVLGYPDKITIKEISNEIINKKITTNILGLICLKAELSDYTYVFDKTVKWTITDPTIAKVTYQNKEVCNIKPLKEGTTTITATLKNGKKDTVTLTVKNILPQKLTVSPSAKTLKRGQTLTLKKNSFSSKCNE